MVKYMKIHQHNPPHKLTEKNPMIISLEAEKVFDKNPTLVHANDIRETRDTGNYLNVT